MPNDCIKGNAEDTDVADPDIYNTASAFYENDRI